MAETLLSESPEDVDLGVGLAERDFLFGYVQFLVEQRIADVDMTDCLIDWLDRDMHPTFIAPLTARGRTLVQLIGEWRERLADAGRLHLPSGVRLAQETFVRIHFTGTDYARMPIIRAFARMLLESAPATAANSAG